MKHKTLLWFAISMILASLLVPAPLLAQETPNAPAEVAQGEAPVTLISINETLNEGVTSFSIPDPGLFWHLDAFCPFIPPSAAAASASSPDAPDGATPFFIRRMTVRGEESRTLMRVDDPTPGLGCNRYEIFSNIVADTNYVYWVDSTGLVRLPVTANIGDTPQLFSDAYTSEVPVELVMTSDRIIALENVPTNPDPLGALGHSSVDAINKTTGELTNLDFYFGFDAGLHHLSYVGGYVYYQDPDFNLIRVDLDKNRVTIATGIVRSYYAEGLILCLLINCGPETDFVYYSKGTQVWRYNNKNGETTLMQTLTGDAGSVVTGRGPITSAIFFFESVFTPSGGFGGTYTHSLYRASRTPNVAKELIYFYTDNSITPVSPSRLTAKGEFLFWTEGSGPQQALKRLPTGVDPLPKVDMEVTGFEVTQGVQKNDNSVRLVQGRETYVRVFVRSLDPALDIQGITMRLYGTVNGVEQGPLIPILPTHLTVKRAPNRNQIGDSFLFALPWSWSQQPSIALRAVLNPFQVPQEPGYANNTSTGTFNFSPGRAIDLIFVEANYRIQRTLNDFSDYIVTDTDVHADWMRDAYPIPENGLNYRVWTINGGALLGNHIIQVAKVCTDMAATLRSLCASDWVNAKISQMRTNAGTGITANTLTYGLIPDSSGTGGNFPRGQAGADRIGSGPSGVSLTADGGGNLIHSDYGYYTGHEIGHMYSRQHPNPNSDDPATTTDAMGNAIVEGCGHSRSDPSFPYASALIGPGDGSVRGFDRSTYNSGGLPRPAVLNDTTSFDMMSYCGNSQLRWPSDYTWEGLYQGIINTPAAIASASLTGDWLGLFGVVYSDTVLVHSVARMSDVTAQSPGDAGPLRLRLLADGGTEIASYLFTPEDGDHSENEGQAFSVVVPFAAGTRTLEIVDVASGEVRYSAAVSASAPTVSNVALTTPPNPVTGTVTLAWQAADADEDTLTYDVYFSANSGTSYQPVALGVATTDIAIDTSSLAGGTGRFRVIANDGVNQGQGDSPDYPMAVKLPDVRIVSPADGATFNWGEVANLSGEALDPQDGLLNTNAFTWSNQKGRLGTGSQLSVADLPVGPNIITLTALNSAGLPASTQITIQVGDNLALPGPTLQVAPAALSFQFAAGETEAKSIELTLDNGGSGQLIWSATSSDAWITVSATNGNVPGTLTITATPTGLAANTLHQSTVTLTGTSTDNPDQVIQIPVGVSIGNSFISPVGEGPEAPNQAGGLRMPFIQK